MKASVKWDSGLLFEGTADSGFTLNLGPGGEQPGFGPMELILVGLIGCTAMDVISILEKKRQKVVDFKVTADADRAEDHPKVFTHVRIHYTITGHEVDPKAVERAIELSETKYCPAQAMLSKAAGMELTYEIVEATG